MLANSTTESAVVEIELTQMRAHPYKNELRDVIVHNMDTVCLYGLLVLSISLCGFS